MRIRGVIVNSGKTPALRARARWSLRPSTVPIDVAAVVASPEHEFATVNRSSDATLFPGAELGIAGETQPVRREQ